MKSCYSYLEGCRVKGLPIGAPFRSELFIPKSKKSKIQDDIDVFILLRFDDLRDLADKNIHSPIQLSDQSKAKDHSGIPIHHQKCTSTTDQIENTCSADLQQKDGNEFGSSQLSGVKCLDENNLSGYPKDRKSELDKLEHQQHDVSVYSKHMANDLGDIVPNINIDMFRILNQLEVVDLCKNVCEKSNNNMKTEKNKHDRKRRSNDKTANTQAKKTKRAEIDGKVLSERKSPRLNSGLHTDYSAIEKGPDPDQLNDTGPDTEQSNKEVSDLEMQPISIVEEAFHKNDINKELTETSNNCDFTGTVDINSCNSNPVITDEADHKSKSKSSKSKHGRSKKQMKEDPNFRLVEGFNKDPNIELHNTAGNANVNQGVGERVLDELDSDQSDDKNNKSKICKGKKTVKVKEDEESDPELVGLSVKEKLLIKRQRKKIEKQLKRIKVKLQEHQDKYRVELMDSFARKDRGKSRLECATEILVCTVCAKFKAKSTDAMESHLESHVNGELHCEQCPYIAPFVNDLTRHKREVHKKNVNICFECGVETNGVDGLRDHLGKVHGKPQYKCKFCLKEKGEQYSATTKNNYRQHIRQVHPDKMAACKTCSRLFANETVLKRHMDNFCAGDKPSYACEKCGKTYNSQDSVNDHVERVHNKVRRFQCPHCPFTAARGAGLSQHLHIHTGYHPFKCDQCTFTCVQKYQLTSHMRTHTGDKPYKCNQCNYAAAWNVQLKDHMKVHGMINTVVCETCNILFKDMRTFKTHQSKEHPMETHQSQQSRQQQMYFVM